MWTNMKDLNRDFGKAFVACTGFVTVASLGIAYYFHKLEEKQQYIYRVQLEDGGDIIVVAHSHNEAQEYAREAGHVPESSIELGSANSDTEVGVQ